MLRMSVLLYAVLIAGVGALSRLKLRHPVPFFLSADDVVRLQRSTTDGVVDNTIERLEIKELEKRSEEGSLSRINLKTETRNMDIELQPMKTIMAPNLRVTVVDGKMMQERGVNKSMKDLFFHGKVEGVEGGVASLMKVTDGWKGVVFSSGEALAINVEESSGEHLLMKMINDEISEIPSWMEASEKRKRNTKKENKQQKRDKKEDSGLKIEVGVYCDSALYKMAQEKYDGEDPVETLQKIALLTINTVNIYYHKPTMGTPIDVVVAKLVIHKGDPPELDVTRDVSKYLNNFCLWETQYKNPRGLHYDVGLLLTGEDLYVDNEEDNGVTGIAPFSGACKHSFASSCVMAEALELAAGVVTAHELGHGFGMEHDGDGNKCDKKGYIMGSILSADATDFSSCSREALQLYIEELDDFNINCLRKSASEKMLNFETDMLPGELLNEDEQCYYAMGQFWYDEYEDEDYCAVLKCWSLLAIAEPYGGPPLPGSHCGENKICWDGKCLEKTAVDELRKGQKQPISSPPPDPLTLDELCEKYGKDGYTAGVAYDKGLTEDSEELRGFCENGLICSTPDYKKGAYVDVPVSPGTPCGKGKVCKNFRCEDKDSPDQPTDSSDVVEVVGSDNQEESKDDEKSKDEGKSEDDGKSEDEEKSKDDGKKKPKIPSETRDSIAKFCKEFASETSVPKPSLDCTIVMCEDALFYYSLPAYLFNMCPDGEMCSYDGECVADSGKSLDGELTQEELKDADQLCKEKYGEEYQSLCIRSALSFSETAKEYCAGDLCDIVGCVGFYSDNTYTLSAFPPSYGSPCGNGETCGLLGCGGLI